MAAQRTRKKLDNHLTLHEWINTHFGYENTHELLHDMKHRDEGFNSNGHSSICEFLMSCAKTELFMNALPIYDANVKRHLSAINSNRTQPIVLRYFQHLALIYTEIFLDWRFNRPEEFLYQLNNFVDSRNNSRAPGDDRDIHFKEKERDLDKLAFWMATGAGKTLIMHINYHQFLHYCQDVLDHLILITPNEGLSEQHMREMDTSDIPHKRFNDAGNSNNASGLGNAVQVIEITKLVENKSGGGVSVPVSSFQGNNLVFVDEGHKGSSSNDPVWRKYRDELAETGFTFEYSATFGQALAAAKNADLVDEYGKSIVFDYSYRYFYEDGYGKNFNVLNVKHDNPSQTERLLLANLLSFYEQQRYFQENTEVVRGYGLELPLWTFVGSRVNAVYEQNRKKRSDIFTVIDFLHRFLKNEGNWASEAIDEILTGKSGLSDDRGNDVFLTRFTYLKRFGETSEELYSDILNKIFHTDSSGALHLRNVRNAQDEIALKSTSSIKDFGVIYIGDTSKFKTLVKSANTDIFVESEDVLAESLFSSINQSNSPVNILIGAKKFIEGWDSWRVSTMGLLNIGRNEGSQIIQLFGRGVRLRGKDMCLKRSSALRGITHPHNLHLLETLNIFAVRANFMNDFQEYLEREGVPNEEMVALPVKIQHNLDDLKDVLYVPDVQPYSEGAVGQCVLLNINTGISIKHITQRADVISSSSQNGVQTKSAEPTLTRYSIPDHSLDRVNWKKIYLRLLEYRQEKKLYNLIFDEDILRKFFTEGTYELRIMDVSEIDPRTQKELQHFEDLILILLCKYVSKFYLNRTQRWNNERVELDKLDKDSDNFTDWNVFVPRNKAKEVGETIAHLVNTGELYDGSHNFLWLNNTFPTVHNDKHLYQPLFASGGANESWYVTPPALVKSEKNFVEDLHIYANNPQHHNYFTKKKVFLLRNQSRGKGIGFYENVGFYPDFILWIISGVTQRVVFIEPHCMMHESIDEENFKIMLFEKLYDISGTRKQFQDKFVQMDSFIISETPFDKLLQTDRSKEELESELHILFPTDLGGAAQQRNTDYLAPIFQEYTL